MKQTASLLERHDFAPRETIGGPNAIPPSGESFSQDNNFDPEYKKPRHAPGFDAASRIAGRINASAISKEEHDTFLAERAALLKKTFDAPLTTRERNRLAYVRWSLDRIEDAKFGANLDILDSAVTQYESVLDEIKGLHERIDELGSMPKKQKPF